jgi:cytochrome c553
VSDIVFKFLVKVFSCFLVLAAANAVYYQAGYCSTCHAAAGKPPDEASRPYEQEQYAVGYRSFFHFFSFIFLRD